MYEHLARVYDILGPKASIQIKQSERWPRFKVDSVARLNPIQVGPVETLQGETREVRAVEKALEVNDGIELNVVDNPV